MRFIAETSFKLIYKNQLPGKDIIATIQDFAISREPFDEIDSNLFYFKGMD